MIAAAWDDRGETSAPAEQQCMLRIKTWKETIWYKFKIDLVQYWNLDIVQALKSGTRIKIFIFLNLNALKTV
jgi:hypothetical protein